MSNSNTSLVEGRNAVLEAFRAGKSIDKLFIQDGLQDGAILTIKREARKTDCLLRYVTKELLDQMSETGTHQGVIAQVAVYEYAELEDLFQKAEEKKEAPFFILLDDVEDPHNLGAIMRTAECAGAHGIIIPKRHSCGLTETVAKASAGAIEYMPVAKVTNIAQTIDELKDRGIWVAACDMGGAEYYRTDMAGKIAVVIGSEGFGVSKLVKEKCDFVVSMPMVGKITSLNASNAAAVVIYEIRKQRDTRSLHM
jgi:23S rRNA (guanosine2251-2'-O)-methyltransferase